MTSASPSPTSRCSASRRSSRSRSPPTPATTTSASASTPVAPGEQVTSLVGDRAMVERVRAIAWPTLAWRCSTSSSLASDRTRSPTTSSGCSRRRRRSAPATSSASCRIPIGTERPTTSVGCATSPLDFGLTVDLEFPSWMEVGDLGDGGQRSSQTSVGPTPGSSSTRLHFFRSELVARGRWRRCPGEWFRFVQLCDAPAAVPPTVEGVIHTARAARSLPGYGQLPLGDLLETLPAVPYALEVPNDVLRRELGTAEYARLVLATAREFVAECGSDGWCTELTVTSGRRHPHVRAAGAHRQRHRQVSGSGVSHDRRTAARTRRELRPAAREHPSSPASSTGSCSSSPRPGTAVSTSPCRSRRRPGSALPSRIHPSSRWAWPTPCSSVRTGPTHAYNTDFSGFKWAYRRRFGTVVAGLGRPVGRRRRRHSHGDGARRPRRHVDADLRHRPRHGRTRLPARCNVANGDVEITVATSAAAAVEGVDGVVNGTPVGMYFQPGTPVELGRDR